MVVNLVQAVVHGVVHITVGQIPILGPFVEFVVKLVA